MLVEMGFTRYHKIMMMIMIIITIIIINTGTSTFSHFTIINVTTKFHVLFSLTL